MLEKCPWSWGWWLVGCVPINDLSSYTCSRAAECAGAPTDLASQMATADTAAERGAAPDDTPREAANEPVESPEQQAPEIELLPPRVEPSGEGPAPFADAGGASTVPVVDAAPVPAPFDAAPQPNPECPLAFGESCYRVSTGAATWLDAELDCQVDGGHVAMIGSQEEDRFVGNLLPFSIWLGAISAASPFLFWVDGSPFTFGHWAPTEPDMPGPLDCIEKREIDEEPWFDLPCLPDTRRYVCERAAVDLE